jgi:alpha-galactosidase
VELRGLADKSYRVTDYVNDRQLGTVRGPLAKLKVSFEKHLLLEAKPR